MTARATLPYRVVDADNHYYETSDCFTRHIESKYAAATLRAERRPDGEFDCFVKGEPWAYLDPKFEKTNRPGSLVEILHRKGDVDWKDSYSPDNMLPGFQDRDARLALMDEQGIEAAILLPTLAVVIEQAMRDDPELTFASLRAFNRWLEDEWGYAYRDRIFAPPLLSLLDLDRALAELERVMALGARVVHLRPGPVAGRSPAHPDYDPFWARVEEARIPVAFHLSDSGYNDLFSTQWGEPADPPVRGQTAFQWSFCHGDRPIMETIGSFIFNNLFTRFPELRILSIENGAGWVEYLLTLLDKKKGMARYGPWLAGRPKGRPSDIFRRHCYLTPYPEDDVARLVEFLGPDNVLFGSDYPHPEGMAEPLGFVDLMGDAGEEAIRKVMRDNTAGLLKLG
jgi:predicted TIM-barrel fold metal-dependent hydrolase